MNFIIPKQVETALNLLEKSGFSAYIVGGAVRDAVMGIVPHDFDIATSALPEETEKVFADFRLIETGLKHGTVTVIIDTMQIEITTFRIENGYSDKRRPDEVIFTDKITEDLSRRDFTCNALAYNPSDGIHNEFFGIEDIDNKLIRCVGEPDKRFNEDALRIMRALRFASVLGFKIEEKTSESIKSNYPLLKYISAERIFNELLKLLAGDNVENILSEYSDVFFFIMPELEAMKGCAQHNRYHIFDVWQHTIKAVSSINNDPELRMTMLLHDSGKPDTKVRGDDGFDHFYGHPEISAMYASQILRRFKASNQTKARIINLVQYHEFRPHLISKKTYKKYIGLLGADTMDELFEVRIADSKAQNPLFLESSLDSIETGRKLVREIIENEACFRIKDLQINGRDLIELGFNSSPELGSVLSQLLDEVIDNKINNEKSVLVKRAKELL